VADAYVAVHAGARKIGMLTATMTCLRLIPACANEANEYVLIVILYYLLLAI
jgi:hypothetical protein